MTLYQKASKTIITAMTKKKKNRILTPIIAMPFKDHSSKLFLLIPSNQFLRKKPFIKQTA